MYKILCVINKLDIKYVSDCLAYARSIFAEFGFDIKYDFVFVDEPIEVVNFWMGKGLIMNTTNKFSTEAIGYHVIAYFYDPKDITGLYNWTYSIDGKPQIQIAVNSAGVNPIGEVIAHELTHSCFVGLKMKGINLIDDLDVNNQGLKSIKEKLEILKDYRYEIGQPMPCDKNLGIMKSMLKMIQEFFAGLNVTKTLRSLAEAMAVVEGFYIFGSRAFRNHNPLNLKYVGQKLAIGQDDKNFCIFKSDEDGWTACLNDLRFKRDGKSITGLSGKSTVRELIKIWTSGDSALIQENYINSVCNKLGISSDFQLGNFIG